jgi:hypothetical protein
MRKEVLEVDHGPAELKRVPLDGKATESLAGPYGFTSLGRELLEGSFYISYICLILYAFA